MIGPVSRELELITDPKHPNYRLYQVSFWGGITYISAILAQVPVQAAMSFIIIALMVMDYTNSFFCRLFERHREKKFFPLMGQSLKVGTACIISKECCYLMGQKISFNEIKRIISAFIVTLFFIHFTLRYIRKTYLN